MKFMLLSYATKDWEAGLPPDPRLLAAIPRLYEKMPKAGALSARAGLPPHQWVRRCGCREGRYL